MIRFNFLNAHIARKRLSSNDNGLRFLKSQNTKERLRAFEISHDDRKMIKMLQHGASPCSRRDGGCKVARRLPSHRYPMMGIRHCSSVVSEPSHREAPRGQVSVTTALRFCGTSVTISYA